MAQATLSFTRAYISSVMEDFPDIHKLISSLVIRLEARLPITAARFVWLQLISGAFPLENFETCFCPMSPTHTTSLGAYKTPAADSEEAPLHGLHAATHQPVINPRKCERPVLVFVIVQVFSTPMRRTTQDLTTVELCSPCSLGSNELHSL